MYDTVSGLSLILLLIPTMNIAFLVLLFCNKFTLFFPYFQSDSVPSSDYKKPNYYFCYMPHQDDCLVKLAFICTVSLAMP